VCPRPSRLGDAVVGHQVRQIENLHIGEDARSTTRGRDEDVDRPVGHALKALGPVRAKLRSDEEFDPDGAVRRLFDEVLEDDKAVIVFVVLVRVCGRPQHDVLGGGRKRRPRKHGRHQQRLGQSFKHFDTSLWSEA
jgi:hypothetical protein